MPRSRFHEHALRAAAAVAFTFTTVACGPYQEVGSPLADAGDALDDPEADAGEGDAGPLVADAGASGDAGPCPVDPWEDFLECCDANGWDGEAGCFAWGPPAPPAFRLGVA